MTRPSVIPFDPPMHINDYPTGPCYRAGNIVTDNSGWRTEVPQINFDKCTGCMECYLYCPEGAIEKNDTTVTIHFPFCKGCGICTKVCYRNAIRLINEGGSNE